MPLHFLLILEHYISQILASSVVSFLITVQRLCKYFFMNCFSSSFATNVFFHYNIVLYKIFILQLSGTTMYQPSFYYWATFISLPQLLGCSSMASGQKREQIRESHQPHPPNFAQLFLPVTIFWRA